MCNSRVLRCMLRASCQAAAVYMLYNAIRKSMTCGGLAHDAATSDVHTLQKSRWTGLMLSLLRIPVIVANTTAHSVSSAKTAMRALRCNPWKRVSNNINGNRHEWLAVHLMSISSALNISEDMSSNNTFSSISVE